MTQAPSAIAEIESPQRPSPPDHSSAAGVRNNSLERWLQNHQNLVAAILVAVAFVIRLVVASKSFLNPDEALHYLLLDQPSVFLAYKANLTNAHPPLLSFLLYFWHFLGHSEVMLRLPSVLAGAAFCWFLFKWMEISFSPAAALFALLFAVFSPSLIGISAELREYSLLLLFLAAALYFFDLAVQEKSSRWMACFCLTLYLAILTHYSAAFFVVSIGLYALVRFASTNLPRQTLALWIVGQFGAAAIYAILYVTHLSKLTSSIPGWSGPYNRFYFHGGFADILTFLRENTLSLFQYLFAQSYVGWIMCVLWVVSIAILLVRGLLPGRGYSRSSQLAILLLLPFMALWCAAIAGKYPYVASRHTIFLAPFAIAAVSALLATIVAQKLWRSLLLAVALIAVSLRLGGPSEASTNMEDKSPASMHSAIDYVHASIPVDDLILSDFQSSLTLAYYLCSHNEVRQFDNSPVDFAPLVCGGRSFVALNYRTWDLSDRNLPSVFTALVRKYTLKPGARVWVLQTGWSADLDTQLQARFPQFRCLAPKRFGKGIVIIPFVVSTGPLPACG